MADTDMASEPVFRASKRRKVFRKRADSDIDDAGGTPGAEAARPGEVPAESIALGEHEGGGEGVLRVQKRAGARRHGITFSSADTPKSEPPGSEETALVPISQDMAQEVQNERFVKPTGREVVTEDKHMMAYIDSKLAEMRSAAAPPADATTTEASGVASMPSDPSRDIAAGPNPPVRPEERTFQLAQARSDRVYQRPTKRPRKKKPRARDEADVARDAYIEQFMQEAQVPIYDRSASKAAAAAGYAGGDNDAATAEAFKAQLLADMENRRRRPPKSASEKAANASHGPKLGGSRQQREKMRAFQEAEAKK